MFEHSIKVPRHFKISANIVKKVATEGGSVKNLLYDSKLRFFRTNVIYALITETIKHSGDVDKLFEATGILTKEPRLDPWLAKVIATELIFGKKELPGRSKPEETILSYKELFEKVPLPTVEVKPEVRRPRYVRINTNLLTTSDAIGAFQDEGYKFIRCTSGSYDDYLKQIQGLTEYDFTQDYHVKTMFVFHPNTKFHDYDLYLENKLILQDKATALPVHLLAPPQGSVILDMCAAPGMKTTQLAAYIRNQGKIYAVERNEQRYETLCDFVKKTESKCVTTMHRDSLDIKKGECDDVEYIILDPSCSGSGMQLSIHNYVEDVRLARLTSLQEKFLKHAMNSFPNAKKIVYSTCSLFPQENERVISNVVKSSRAKWKVLNVKELLKGNWNNFGSGMYGEMGTRCLYSKPDSDLTTGFFLAVLERDPKQEKPDDGTDKEPSNVKKKKTKRLVEEDSVAVEAASPELNDGEFSKDRKKKKKSKEECEVQGLPSDNSIKKKKHKEADSENNYNVEENKLDNEDSKKSKKKNKKDRENDLAEESSFVPDNNVEDSVVEQKKKKKRKNKENAVEEKNESTDVNTNRENDSAEEICFVPDNNVEDSIEVQKKKKKRKNKENAIEERNVSIDNTNGDSCEPVKKKKKRNKE
ncbi:28S rRNA (cytosine-C(5))-methyltransferase [Pieris rapae]|uniref:28S rRNA (cytosine-C(5))-methyltransferase n=1 Tax=Pieris rapae TaxID=64459 RepID=UPI001E27F583|nr:28S rRNA (cytosine-C(5))-methyltransferase [Pieris rapae]